MTKAFTDENINKFFYENGFVKHGQIDKKTVDDLINLSENLKIPDFVGCDFNCGMNSDIYDARKAMQDNLTNILMPFFEPLLDNYSSYSSSFVNKNPNDKFLILAHQDFSYTREPEIPSIMCWIPLVDVDINNGAIGFIPKSHLMYDYNRAFPFPAYYTPVVKNEIELMNYVKIIDMKAGEMVFFMNNTIHGSFANYTDKVRYAININFVKKGEKIYAYIRNPKTDGATLLKYEVDKYFLVRHNNPTFLEMYKNGKIELPEKPTEEVPFGNYDTSWSAVKQKLDELNIKEEARNKTYVDKFKRQQFNHKIKEKIYYSLLKLNPFRKETANQAS